MNKLFISATQKEDFLKAAKTLAQEFDLYPVKNPGKNIIYCAVGSTMYVAVSEFQHGENITYYLYLSKSHEFTSSENFNLHNLHNIKESE